MTLASRIRKALGSASAIRPATRHLGVSTSSLAEDFVFNRLLNPGTKGFYVDVGANHPVEASNTFALYLKGWSGIAIDPNPRFSRAFKKIRPRDIHLCEGVAMELGELTYYQFRDDVLNTLSEERARIWESHGNKIMSTTSIPVRPLSVILDTADPGRHIDFLNVDCEGLDIEVLRSLDLRVRRPTVLTVEDYRGHINMMNGGPQSEFEGFLRRFDYLPLARCAWSAIYVAADWRHLMSLSEAYPNKDYNGYMPGQES